MTAARHGEPIRTPPRCRWQHVARGDRMLLWSPAASSGRHRARVLTGVKVPRCAPPPLRGAYGLDAGSAHARPDWPLPTMPSPTPPPEMTPCWAVVGTSARPKVGRWRVGRLDPVLDHGRRRLDDDTEPGRVALVGLFLGCRTVLIGAERVTGGPCRFPSAPASSRQVSSRNYFLYNSLHDFCATLVRQDARRNSRLGPR